MQMVSMSKGEKREIILEKVLSLLGSLHYPSLIPFAELFLGSAVSACAHNCEYTATSGGGTDLRQHQMVGLMQLSIP